MLTAQKLLSEARAALSRYGYYRRLEILSQGKSYIKFRLYIPRRLFVQINRNEKARLTNMTLVQSHKRMYGRDEYRSIWHRHPVSDPDFHDSSPEGRREVTLTEFPEEVNSILKLQGLI